MLIQYCTNIGLRIPYRSEYHCIISTLYYSNINESSSEKIKYEIIIMYKIKKVQGYTKAENCCTTGFVI